MILGTIFALTFGLILLLQVATADLIAMFRQTARDMDTAVGHDTMIFPDHDP
jgi:hypothetical protein